MSTHLECNFIAFRENWIFPRANFPLYKNQGQRKYVTHFYEKLLSDHSSHIFFAKEKAPKLYSVFQRELKMSRKMCKLDWDLPNDKSKNLPVDLLILHYIFYSVNTVNNHRPLFV